LRARTHLRPRTARRDWGRVDPPYPQKIHCKIERRPARLSVGISMKKVFRIIGYVFGAIVLIRAIAIGCAVVIDPFTALTWHCLYGDKRVFDRHTYTVPILWRPIN